MSLSQKVNCFALVGHSIGVLECVWVSVFLMSRLAFSMVALLLVYEYVCSWINVTCRVKRFEWSLTKRVCECSPFANYLHSQWTQKLQADFPHLKLTYIGLSQIKKAGLLCLKIVF